MLSNSVPDAIYSFLSSISQKIDLSSFKGYRGSIEPTGETYYENWKEYSSKVMLQSLFEFQL